MAITSIGVQPVIASAGEAAAQQTYMIAAGNEISLAVSCTNDLSVGGNFNVVHWESDGASILIYKALDGLFGYIGETDGKRFIDDNIAPDLKRPPPPAPEPTPLPEGATPKPVALQEAKKPRRG